MEKRDTLFIGGQWVASASGKVIDVISPYTEEVMGLAPEACAADVDAAKQVSVASSGASVCFRMGLFPGSLSMEGLSVASPPHRGTGLYQDRSRIARNHVSSTKMRERF